MFEESDAPPAIPVQEYPEVLSRVAGKVGVQDIFRKGPPARPIGEDNGKQSGAFPARRMAPATGR